MDTTNYYSAIWDECPNDECPNHGVMFDMLDYLEQHCSACGWQNHTDEENELIDIDKTTLEKPLLPYDDDYELGFST